MAGFPGPSGGRTLDWQFLQCFGERVAGEDIQDGEGADGKREQKRNDAKNKTERRRRLSEGGGEGGGRRCRCGSHLHLMLRGSSDF
jgi:hypothetical protein